ncbi:hypothetical protein FA15DRAFT_653436 [Coprinopsis marcescibilis]|uniref:Uncharacterized protein n=1 Tax=Coprinopsis marcescibilis TaxID=230819 RepID=A0A5C3L3Z4_COPMA|nr:hypothetical protein FA15DRAFT_653436 [Coprinopsis marcescibilis]
MDNPNPYGAHRSHEDPRGQGTVLKHLFPMTDPCSSNSVLLEFGTTNTHGQPVVNAGMSSGFQPALSQDPPPHALGVDMTTSSHNISAGPPYHNLGTSSHYSTQAQETQVDSSTRHPYQQSNAQQLVPHVVPAQLFAPQPSSFYQTPQAQQSQTYAEPFPANFESDRPMSHLPLHPQDSNINPSVSYVLDHTQGAQVAPGGSYNPPVTHRDPNAFPSKDSNHYPQPPEASGMHVDDPASSTQHEYLSYCAPSHSQSASSVFGKHSASGDQGGLSAEENPSMADLYSRQPLRHNSHKFRKLNIGLHHTGSPYSQAFSGRRRHGKAPAPAEQPEVEEVDDSEPPRGPTLEDNPKPTPITGKPPSIPDALILVLNRRSIYVTLYNFMTRICKIHHDATVQMLLNFIFLDFEVVNAFLSAFNRPTIPRVTYDDILNLHRNHNRWLKLFFHFGFIAEEIKTIDTKIYNPYQSYYVDNVFDPLILELYTDAAETILTGHHFPDLKEFSRKDDIASLMDALTDTGVCGSYGHQYYGRTTDVIDMATFDDFTTKFGNSSCRESLLYAIGLATCLTLVEGEKPTVRNFRGTAVVSVFRCFLRIINNYDPDILEQLIAATTAAPNGHIVAASLINPVMACISGIMYHASLVKSFSPERVTASGVISSPDAISIISSKLDAMPHAMQDLRRGCEEDYVGLVAGIRNFLILYPQQNPLDALSQYGKVKFADANHMSAIHLSHTSVRNRFAEEGTSRGGDLADSLAEEKAADSEGGLTCYRGPPTWIGDPTKQKDIEFTLSAAPLHPDPGGK